MNCTVMMSGMYKCGWWFAGIQVLNLKEEGESLLDADLISSRPSLPLDEYLKLTVLTCSFISVVQASQYLCSFSNFCVCQIACR